MSQQGVDSRRDFVKKAVYVAPMIATLMAAPSLAKAGSNKSDRSGHRDHDRDYGGKDKDRGRKSHNWNHGNRDRD